MHTSHLSQDQVDAYLRDLADKIKHFKEGVPEVWATAGASGSILGRHLANLAPDLFEQADELLIAYDRSTDAVSFPFETDVSAVVRGKRVLLIDGTVHSGGTLLRILRALESFSPAALSTYALVVQRGAKVIPNHFGFLIGDHDRVQFPGSTLHNNRLHDYGIYRKLSDEDASRPPLVTGTEFMDKITWEDRLYEVATDANRHIYVHEHNGTISGFVSFRLTPDRFITLDEVGVDVKQRGIGVGGHLMRWAEHCARHRNCKAIELWSVDNKVDWYVKLGYETGTRRPLAIGGHMFSLMQKKLLYNLPNEDTLSMGN